MRNEKREQQMMDAADAYAAEIYKDEPDNFHTDEQLCGTISDFCAGWRAADDSKWIPVEEELPKENGKTQQSISVWATNGLMSGEFRYNFDTKTWTDMWGDPFDITYWMPCPQLPRNEE